MGDDPATEIAEKSIESVEEVVAPSTEQVRNAPASSEDDTQLSGEEKGAEVQVKPPLEDKCRPRETRYPPNECSTSAIQRRRSLQPIAGPAQEDEEENTVGVAIQSRLAKVF